MYHEPPVAGTIRIPPHLWPMLRNELDQFLVEKSTNDYALLSWYVTLYHTASLHFTATACVGSCPLYKQTIPNAIVYTFNVAY